ncbi:MAG: MG2 domain-containing protein [Promethearchaeota archaeon]
MKTNKIIMKAGVFLAIIFVQIIAFGLNNVIAVSYNRENQIDQVSTDSPSDYFSHSSPYFFSVNPSSPLITEDSEDSSNENLPKSASYQPEASSYYYSYNDYALSINLDKSAITNGDQIHINLYHTCNLTPSIDTEITVKIYRGFYRDYNSYYKNYYDYDQIYLNARITDDNGQASLNFSETSETGLYTIYAYSNYYKAYNQFTVGEVGLFLKGSKYYTENQQYRAALQVINLSDFSPSGFVDYSYSLSQYDWEMEDWKPILTGEGVTNEYGYAVFTTDGIPESMNNYYYYSSLKLTINTTVGSDSAEYSTFLYRSWNDYYYVLWGGEQEVNRDRFQYVVTTDKTIYNPGEIIHLRSLVMEYSFLNETKNPLTNQVVYLTIYNPDELAIFWTTATTDDSGILTFEFFLDEDCDLGNYGFELSLGSDKYRYNVDVQYYTKPVFRVEIDTNGKDFFPRSENIFSPTEPFKGTINVEYYFGQPVADATVNLYIKDYSGAVKHTIQGITDGEGKYHFSIYLSSDIYWSFNVQANVTDTYGRTAAYEKRYSRINELYAYGYLSNWAPDPSEDLDYYFYAYQIMMGENGYNYEYNGLVNATVDIEVYGISEYPIIITTITNRVKLATFESTTNSYGSGNLKISLPWTQIILFHFFEIRLSITLEDGRSKEYSTYFRYKKYSLDLEIHTPSLNSGEILEFTATYKDTLIGLPCTGEGRIYIYNSDYRLLGRASVILSGSKTYTIHIPDFSPEGTYYIYSYVYSRSNQFFGGFNYHSAYESFTVGSKDEITLTTNASITGANAQELYVKEGEILEISGTSNVSTNLPHYFEIYKRGLMYSYPLTISGGEFSEKLLISSKMGPDFTIMVYTISDTGKIFEDHLVVHINYSYGFDISTDKEIYEPGDEIILTITLTNNNTPYLLSLSFIDSSVLDVKPEDDSELGYFSSSSYYAYIGSESSWGTGIDYRNYWWISYESNHGGYYQPMYWGLDYNAPGGMREENLLSFGTKKQGMQDSPPSFNELQTEYETEIRENISESCNWIPKILISEETNITFKLPDNIGEWTIRAIGNSIGSDDGHSKTNILWGDVVSTQIKTFLPFIVEFEIPEPVVQDDILTIKAYIYNYIGSTAESTVAINAPEFVILNKEVQEIIVPDGFVSEIEFTVYCTKAYLHNITILAATNVNGLLYSDAKLLPIYVHPNGIEIYNRTSGFLNASEGSVILNYSLDPQAIYHQETFALYGDLIDISIESWVSLIGYPYGCIEQTMSKLVPTALIYNYLNTTGQLSSSLKEKMTLMIMDGLNRVYGFQHSDGGWGWWRDDISKVLMTAIVVSGLNQISEAGFQINPSIISNAAEFLIDHQELDGSWGFPYYTANNFESTTFTMKSLLTLTNITAKVNASIQSAIDILQILWESEEMRSPYGASLYYIAISDSSYENSTFCDMLITYIKNSKQSDGSYIFWTNPQSYYWRNLGRDIEITSYAAWALAIDDYIDNYAVVKKSVQFLLSGRGRFGWHNTADTAAAIISITAIKTLMSGYEIVDFNGNLSVNIDEVENSQYELMFTEEVNQPGEIALSLEDYISVGSNQINLTLNGTGQISYVFESVQVLRSSPVVEMPELIEVSTDEVFYLNISFSEINSRMPLTDTEISIIDLPESMRDPDTNYTVNIPTISNGDEISFLLIAPSEPGTYELEGASISGIIKFQDTEDNAVGTQLYLRNVGPISLQVSSSSPMSSSIGSSNPKDNISISPFFLQSSSGTSENLTLIKLISKNTKLLPGDIISVSLLINNNGDPRQFYALDDAIPAGTVFLEDTIEISGDLNLEDENSAITFDQSVDRIHFFFPVLDTGTIEITYRIQVESVKNSYLGHSTLLWGMYDNITISARSGVLENIQRKYYSNGTIYRDLSRPTVYDVIYSQIKDSSEIRVVIDFCTLDDNQIYKIRIIFSQGLGWRSKTIYSMCEKKEFSANISGFKNMDSSVEFFVEVSDIYGNIALTSIFPLVVHSTIIPYLAIGGLIGLSMGLAGIASIYYKKRNQNSQIQEYKDRKISFLEETEETEILEESREE